MIYRLETRFRRGPFFCHVTAVCPPPIQYLRQFRIQKAAEALISTSERVPDAS